MRRLNRQRLIRFHESATVDEQRDSLTGDGLAIAVGSESGEGIINATGA